MGYLLPFTKDHPHLRSPQGAMSCDELRYWIKTLLEEFDWRPLPLARALGIWTDNRHAGGHVVRKLSGGWIYPGEQIRFSRGIRKIIAGELVCAKVSGREWGAVVANNPRPLRLPARLRYNLGAGRLEYVPKELGTKPTLPSFRDVLTKAEVMPWRG